MTRSEQLTSLTASGELTQMYINGIVGYKVLMYRDIYFHLDIEQQQGHSRMQSIQNTADIFGVDKSTVYRAVKFMTDGN
jgi:hypothetical protein